MPGESRRDEAIRLFEQGQRAFEVARALNVPESTCRDWRREWQGQQPSSDDLKDMKIAALEAKLKIAEGTRPQVVPAYVPPESSTPEARWRAAEIDNAEHIRKALLMARFSVELPGEPCAITFISDQHVSLGNTVDLARMREDAELVASQDGVYAVLGGDACDNHIKHRSAVLAARSQPSDQFELFEWYLSIFAHRVLVAISGNHDLWTNQIAGVDVLGNLLHRNRVCYAPDEALLEIKLGSQTYKVGMRHQYRFNSSFNQTHTVKQWFKNGDYDWDIGCIGHHHVSSVEPFWVHGIERWACRPGSYQITSAYARQFGFGATCPKCPTFVVYPDRREIVGFHDLRPALRLLSAERGK